MFQDLGLRCSRLPQRFMENVGQRKSFVIHRMPHFALLQSQAGSLTTNLYAKYRDKAIGWKFLREVKVTKGLSWTSFEYIKGDGAIEREFLNLLRASENPWRRRWFWRCWQWKSERQIITHFNQKIGLEIQEFFAISTWNRTFSKGPIWIKTSASHFQFQKIVTP